MSVVQRLTMQLTIEDDLAVIGACGELDFTDARYLVDTLVSILREPYAGCAVDCSKLTFIDSEAIKSLLDVSRLYASAQKPFFLRCCSSPIARVLELLGLSSILMEDNKYAPTPACEPSKVVSSFI